MRSSLEIQHNKLKLRIHPFPILRHQMTRNKINVLNHLTSLTQLGFCYSFKTNQTHLFTKVWAWSCVCWKTWSHFGDFWNFCWCHCGKTCDSGLSKTF